MEAALKTSIFFDGKNFYSGWRDLGQNQRLDFPRLAQWLLQSVGGTVLTGCHYYTGVENSDDSAVASKLTGFLTMLELQRGFHILPHDLDRARLITEVAEFVDG